MRLKNRPDRDEQLRNALRRGDPAASESELAPSESREMRRAVLNAIPEPRRSHRLLPVFAGALVAVLSLAVTLALWRAREGGPAVPRTPLAPGQKAAAPAITTVPKSPPAMATASTAKSASRPPRGHRRSRGAAGAYSESPFHPSAPDRPVEEATLEDSQDTATRQVQFSTPGGTRIIWLLHEGHPSR